MGAKPSLTAEQLVVGHVYEAKRPRATGFVTMYFDDRQILYIGRHGFRRNGEEVEPLIVVQYDSPSVKMGRKFPKVPLEKFLKWAGRDVTEQCLPGEWRTFHNGERQED